MNRLELHGGGTTSCGYHRITLPFSRLEVDLKVPTLVFNRLVPGGAPFLQQKRRQGYRIVADIDDFWELPPDHYLAASWAVGRTPVTIRACLAAADIVMVTNAELAVHVAAVNPSIVIVPNALPFDEDQFVESERAGRTFIYAAGPSHVPDITPLLDVFDHEDVTVAGGDSKHPEWKRMQALLPRAAHCPGKAVTEYMRLYDGHMAALAPLRGNAFNRCKSNLKTLEAGAKGLPLIASKVLPYLNDLDERFVLYAEDAHDWKRHMRAIMAYPDYAAELGSALAEHVRRHYHLDHVNEIRRQVLEDGR